MINLLSASWSDSPSFHLCAQKTTHFRSNISFRASGSRKQAAGAPPGSPPKTKGVGGGAHTQLFYVPGERHAAAWRGRQVWDSRHPIVRVQAQAQQQEQGLVVGPSECHCHSLSLILLCVQDVIKSGTRPLEIPRFTTNLPFTYLWDEEMKAYYNSYSNYPFYKLSGIWEGMDTEASYREVRHLSIRTSLR